MTPRRLPKLEPIRKRELRPGDVLLSYGQEPLSRMIRFLGGGSYSHAALWDGTHIVETSTDDVTLVPLRCATEGQRYVDIYRWQTLEEPVRVLGSAGYESAPVARYGTGIGTVGLGFANDEAVMLGLIVTLSDLSGNLLLRQAVRVALSLLADWIHDRIAPDHRAMICTETVCTAFWEADPATRRYAVHIDLGGSREIDVLQAIAPPTLHGILGPAEEEADELRRMAATLFLQASGQEAAFRARAAAVTPMLMGIGGPPPGPGLREVGGPLAPLGCVTPHDLQHSPNLQPVGRLSQRRAKPLPRKGLGRLVRLLKVP